VQHVSILLVDDETLFREGLRALLCKEDFIVEIYDAANAKEFRSQLQLHPIDVVLLDMRLPGVKGLELLLELRKRKNPPKVIALTGLEGLELIINLLKSGVNGIAFKLDGYSEILKTLKAVIEGGSYFQEKILKIIQNNTHCWENAPPVLLNFLETELLLAISQGHTTKVIASLLKMTEATTETYRIRLIKKLKAPNTAALLAYAFKNGIL
jgi:DNA-binding NarL/FixJ family response regulator